MCQVKSQSWRTGGIKLLEDALLVCNCGRLLLSRKDRICRHHSGRALRFKKVVWHEVEKEPTVPVGQLIERLRHLRRCYHCHTQRRYVLSPVEPVQHAYDMSLEVIGRVLKVILRFINERDIVDAR